MNGFEANKWIEIKSSFTHVKYFKHEDFPFIRFNFKKIHKNLNLIDASWTATIGRRDMSTYKYGEQSSFQFSCQRLTKNILPKIFDELMKYENIRLIIIDLVFRGELK